MILFFRRIYAMILRHIYLFMVSWPRVLELIYWPFLNMVLWAFMSKFLAQNSNIFLLASGVLIASVRPWRTDFECRDSDHFILSVHFLSSISSSSSPGPPW